MDSPTNLNETWAASTTRSFYNSPHYAEFMALQGNKISYLDIGDPDHAALLPFARPTVWTHWRKTRLPIPPPLAPTHSIYEGILLTDDPAEYSFSRIFDRVRGARWSKLYPEMSFVQPALIESGPASFLDEFISAIAESGFPSNETYTRVISLPPGRVDDELLAGHLLPKETQHDSSDAANLLASYSKKRRYDIRRARQLGVNVEVVRVEADEQATKIYSSIMELHRESWSRTGLGPHTLSYWCALSKSIRESGGRDIVARAYSKEGTLVSVVNVHVRGQSAFYQMNSSSLDGQKLSANPATLHAAIVAAKIWGAQYFELGRYSLCESAKGRSVYAYKEEYGGDVLPVPNFRVSTIPNHRLS